MVFLIVGQQRQGVVVVEVQGQGWRDIQTIVRNVIGLRVGFTPQHHHPTQDSVTVVERARDIHTQLASIIRTITHLHLALRGCSRVFTHQINQTTGCVFTVEQGRRAAENLDPFQAVGFAGGVVSIALNSQTISQQAVAVIRGVETANEKQIACQAVARRERWGEDSRYVAQHFCQGLGLLVLDTLASDNGHRTRSLGQRCAGLRADPAVLRLVAYIPGDLLIEAALLISADGGRGQGQLASRCRL